MRGLQANCHVSAGELQSIDKEAMSLQKSAHDLNHHGVPVQTAPATVNLMPVEENDVDPASVSRSGGEAEPRLSAKLTKDSIDTDEAFKRKDRLSAELGKDSLDADDENVKSKDAHSTPQIEGSGSVGAVVAKGECTAAESQALPGDDDATAHKSGDSAADDHSTWETVEAKSRGNRAKKSGQMGSGKSASHHATHVLSAALAPGSAGGAPTKKHKKAHASRRRGAAAARKIVKDVVASILDGVDAEVARKRAHEAKSNAKNRLHESKIHAFQPDRNTALTNGVSHSQGWHGRQLTMRDVVLGKLRAEAEADKSGHDSTPSKRTTEQANPQTGASHSIANETAERLEKKAVNSGDKPKGPASSLRGAPKLGWVADQSIAPTVPETLSGISANTQSSENTEGDNGSENCSKVSDKLAENITADESSSGDIVESTTAIQHNKDDKKQTSPSPPLQTLLGPGSTYSASSSVASSLEAPHASHICPANENDVGYHLLNVCDRLSHDMDVFMGRRSLALGIRRRERGALLAALQDTASVSQFQTLRIRTHYSLPLY